MSTLALGLIETRGLVAAIEAADAAAKAATITLASAELLGGGIVTLRIRGDLGAVQAAVEAGAQAAKRIGEVIAVRVIPRPVEELEALAPIARSEHTRSIDLTLHREIRKSTGAPSGALPPNVDISVPHRSETRIRPTKSVTVKRTAQRTHPEQPARPTSTPAAATTSRPAPATTGGGRATLAELEAMSVVKLRQYARSVKNLPIQGRQISMANKTQLLDAIRQAAS